MRMMGILTLAALAVFGCKEQAPWTEDAQNTTPPKVDVPVSAEIERLIAAPFPADGKIHVQSKGRFEIKPETLLCGYQSYVATDIQKTGIKGAGFSDLESILLDLGLDNYKDGSSKVRPVGERCPAIVRNFMFTGKVLLNSKAKPYKLVIAAWQGDVAAGKGAYWIGGIERLEGRRPDVPQSLDIANKRSDLPVQTHGKKQNMEDGLLKSSIAKDTNDISKLFQNSIVREFSNLFPVSAHGTPLCVKRFTYMR